MTTLKEFWTGRAAAADAALTQARDALIVREGALTNAKKAHGTAVDQAAALQKAEAGLRAVLATAPMPADAAAAAAALETNLGLQRAKAIELASLAEAAILAEGAADRQAAAVRAAEAAKAAAVAAKAAADAQADVLEKVRHTLTAPEFAAAVTKAGDALNAQPSDLNDPGAEPEPYADAKRALASKLGEPMVGLYSARAEAADARVAFHEAGAIRLATVDAIVATGGDAEAIDVITAEAAFAAVLFAAQRAASDAEAGVERTLGMLAGIKAASLPVTDDEKALLDARVADTPAPDPADPALPGAESTVPLETEVYAEEVSLHTAVDALHDAHVAAVEADVSADPAALAEAAAVVAARADVTTATSALHAGRAPLDEWELAVPTKLLDVLVGFTSAELALIWVAGLDGDALADAVTNTEAAVAAALLAHVAASDAVAGRRAQVAAERDVEAARATIAGARRPATIRGNR